jgi:PPM family protein phosphatase
MYFIGDVRIQDLQENATISSIISIKNWHNPFQTMAQLHFSALSDRGIRSINNDAFCAEKIGNYYVFGVAEGPTDTMYGGAASRIAISCLKENSKNQTNSPAVALARAVHESDARISAHAAASPDRTMDATHLSACLIDDALECTILDTGEGNAYLVSHDSIQVPREHAVSRHLQAPGFPEQDNDSEKKLEGMISHTLGEPRILAKTDFVMVNIANHFLLFSSGGLHDYVKKDRIAEIVLQNGENVEASCEFLLQEALSAGSDRTITLVLIHGHHH